MFWRWTSFLLWLALLGYSYKLANQIDVDVFGNGPPVATLTASVGEIQIRPLEFEVWNPVDAGQELFEGNVIATGDEASAVVAFVDGRQLEIGPNTQLVLSQGGKSDGSEQIVTLLKGSLTAKAVVSATGASSPALTLRSGDAQVILAEADSSVELNKSVNASQAELKVFGGRVAVIDKEQAGDDAVRERTVVSSPEPVLLAVAPVEAKSDPLFAPFLPQKTMVFAAKAKPETEDSAPSALASLKQLVFPQFAFDSNATYWHVASIKKGEAPSLEVPLKEPMPGSQSSFAKVVGGGDVRWLDVNTGSLAIAPQEFGKVASLETSLYSLRLYGAAAYVPDSEKATIEQTPISLKYGSLADVSDESLQVNVQTLSGGPSPTGWFVQRGTLSDEAAAFQVTLSQGRYLKAMAPQLQKSQRFSFRPASLPAVGIYLAKRDGLVASVSGKTLRRGDIDQLMKTLGVGFAFRGKASSQIIGSNLDTLLAALQQENSDVYVLHDGRLHRINRSLLQAKPLATQFVLQNGEAFFKAPVDIVHVREVAETK